MTDKEAAALLVEAIKTLSERPEALENLKSYLSHHFTTWQNRFAYDPENLAGELWNFANIEL